MPLEPSILIVAAVGPLLIVLGALAIWRRAFRRELEALHKSNSRDVDAAVAVLGDKISRPHIEPGVPNPAERFRAASRAVRALAKSVSLGLEDNREAEAIRQKALAVLSLLTSCDAAALLTVIVARAGTPTLEWLADELARAAGRLEKGVSQGRRP